MLKTLRKFIFRLRCSHDRWVISRSRPGYHTCQRCRKRAPMKSFVQRIMAGGSVDGDYAEMARDMEKVRIASEIAMMEDRRARRRESDSETATAGAAA